MTVYHAERFAHELTKRCASDSVAKLATTRSRTHRLIFNPRSVVFVGSTRYTIFTPGGGTVSASNSFTVL